MKNGKLGKLTICIAMLVICMVSMSGCTTWDNFKYTFIDKADNKNVVYIGVFEPQTGELSDNGNDEIKGIELANSIYNNVIGYDVELVKVDTQSKPKAAKSAIKSLIKMKPVAIIGSTGEAESLIAASQIQKAKIPTITPSAINPLITQDNGYYFRASITNSQMGAGLAEYAYMELNSRAIGLIGIRNDSTVTAIVDGFDEAITSMNGSDESPILLKDNIMVTDDNWNPILKKIKKAKVNVVFIPIGVENADSFFTAVEKKGMTDITFLGTKAWGTDEFADILKKHSSIKVAFPYDSVVNTNKSTENTVTAETQRFLIEYAEKYGEHDEPSQYAALGYDSYLLIINAINNAASFDGDAIRQALLNLSGMQCATGVFQFDSKGNTLRNVNIATIKNGNIVSAYTTKGTSKAKAIEEIDK